MAKHGNNNKGGGFGGFLASAGGGAAITGLSSLLGGFAGLIGGPSESQKRSRSVFDLIQNRIGQSQFDPNLSLSKLMLALQPGFNRADQIAGKGAGFDSGVVTGAGARERQSTLAQILASFQLPAANLNARTGLGNLSLLTQSAANS